MGFDLPGALRRLKAAGDARLPISKDGGEAVAEWVREGTDLLPEVPHQTAPAVVEARHAGAGILDKGAQAGKRREALIQEPAIELVREIGGISIDQSQAELRLAAEVVVK